MKLRQTLLLKLMFILLISGCATTYTTDEIRGSYEENVERIKPSFFAFSQQGDSYYFGHIQLENDIELCHVIVGFKNDVQTYLFPAIQLNVLQSLYDSGKSIDKKIDLTITKVNQLNLKNAQCPLEYSRKKLSFVEKTVMITAYTPFALLAIPLMIPAAILQMKDNDFIRKVKKLRLGMSVGDINKIIPILNSKKSKHKYFDHYLDVGKYRLVMNFNNKKLRAFVFGIHNTH